MGLGTVDLSARVYNPDGSQFTHPQTVSNMEIDKQTNHHHKDALSTLETDVDAILKDGKGNL
jgi:hypothetical protein